MILKSAFHKNSLIKIASASLALLITLGCSNIPFLSQEEKNNDDLINLAVLAAAASAASSNPAGPGTVRCDGSNGRPRSPKETVTLTQGGSIFTTGIAQVSSNDQNAFIQRETNGNLDWCIYYDTSPADTKGEAIAGDGSSIYVVMTTDGGNASFRATSNAVQSSYGTGGGPKVSFVAQISPTLGTVLAGTYLGARLDNGRVNSLFPQDIPNPLTVQSDRIVYRAITAYDGGQARDSLTPGVVCQSGSNRTITLPRNLTRDNPFSATCGN